MGFFSSLVCRIELNLFPLGVVKIGEIMVSVQELGLKSCFFEDTNLDLPTLAGSGSPKFLGVVTFLTLLRPLLPHFGTQTCH